MLKSPFVLLSALSVALTLQPSVAKALEGGTVTIQELGGTCDGKADDTQAVKQLFELLGNDRSPVRHATVSGTCRITAPLVLRPKPGSSLSGVGPTARIECSGVAGWCWTIAGGATSSAGVPISAYASRGARELTVTDASGFHPGDYISLLYRWSKDPNRFSQGEINKITTINDKTLSLEHPLSFSISLAGYSATAKKVVLGHDFSIDNITVSGTLAGDRQQGLNITNFAHAKISRVTVQDFRFATQTALYIANCDACTVERLSATRINGHAIYLSGLSGSKVTGIRVQDLVGVPVEYTWSSRTALSHILVRLLPASGARAFKITGSSGNSFADLSLSGGSLETGLSLTSGTSHNSFNDVTSVKSSSCIWLNGTANDFNVFNRVRTAECVFRGTGTIAPHPGFSISTNVTAPFVDRKNTFNKVSSASKNNLRLTGEGNTANFERE